MPPQFGKTLGQGFGTVDPEDSAWVIILEAVGILYRQLCLTDSAHAGETRRQDGNGLVTQVVSLFLVTIQQNLEKMRAHRADNREAPQQAAHSLISSAAQVGAMQVSVLAAKVEETMREGDAVELESLLARLEVAVDQAAPELNALVNSTPV